MADISHWVWWSLAIGLGALGLGLLGWALLWDRSRGRLRCPRCWYRMEGAPEGDAGPRCPECGRTIGRARALRRTRRRWRWAILSCLLLVGAGVSSVTPRGLRDGWLSVVPTTALLLAPVDVVGPTFDAWVDPEPERPEWLVTIHTELVNRVDAAPLSGWQDWLLGWRVRRVAARLGDPPVGSEAQALFDRMCRSTVRLRGGPLSLASLAEAIAQQTGIACRTTGPEDEVLMLQTAAGSWGLVQVLDGIEGGWDEPSPFCTWTIDDDSLVIGEEGSIYELPDAWCVACYDLGRVALPVESGPIPLIEIEGARLDTSSPIGYEYEDAHDAILMTTASALFLEGGGSARSRRVGRWLVVRAPEGVHVRLEAMLRTIEKHDASARLPSGSVGPWEWWEESEGADTWPVWVAYDLSPIIQADMRSRDEILATLSPAGAYRADPSPFSSFARGSAGMYYRDYVHSLGDVIASLVDPSSWMGNAGGDFALWRVANRRLFVRQTAANQAGVGQFLQALAAHEGRGFVDDEGTIAWGVFDTTPLWKAVAFRAQTGRDIHPLESTVRSGIERSITGLIGESEPAGSESGGWVCWQEAGRLVVRASPAELDRIGAWLDAALHDDATLDLLAGIRAPDDE